MKRVTDSQLNAVVNRLNDITGSPIEPYRRTPDGIVANIGNFHLDYAYGMVRLVRMHNGGGGIDVVTQYGTKRKCLEEMYAFESGYVAALAHIYKK
jgi:hypothetical protein